MATDAKERFINEDTKYVWLDEDGNEMSPVHGRMRSALNFINGWKKARERVQGLEGTYHFTGVTKTGKPPARLERRIIRTYAAPLTSKQEALVDTYLEDLKEEME